MDDERAVGQVLARYVRAADHRSAADMAALFTDDAVVEIQHNNIGTWEPVTRLQGAHTIGQAVAGLMQPHPPLGWSHHTTHDHLTEVNGDHATIDAQFVVFSSRGRQRPAEGWPAGATGVQGTITPIESGYYRPRLKRIDGQWRIYHHTIALDQPMALPGL